MTWAGIPPSGQIKTFEFGGGLGYDSYSDASGDVVGRLRSLIVIGLQGNPVSPSAPISGEVLAWNGASWFPTNATAVFSGVHNLLSDTHVDTEPASPEIGDIITGSGQPPRWARLPAGEFGQSLRVGDSGVVWQYDDVAMVSGVSSVQLYRDNKRVLVTPTGQTSVFLPNTPYLGQEITVKDYSGNASTNNITVSASGQNIDAFPSIKLTQNYQSYSFIWGGNGWGII